MRSLEAALVEHRRALVRRRVGVGDHHCDQEVRRHGVGAVPLVAVDHPLVALQPGGGGEPRRVGAGILGLGHREGGDQLAFQQRQEPALLLLLVTDQGQDLAVARVGGLVAENPGRPIGLPFDLVHQPELHLAVTLAAELGRQVRRPEAARLDLLLEVPDDAHEGRVVAFEDLEWDDRLTDEAPHPGELLRELRVGAEVPAHRSLPLLTRTFLFNLPVSRVAP